MPSKKKDWRVIAKDKIALLIFVVLIAVGSIVVGKLTGVSPLSPSATISETAKNSAQNQTNEAVINETVSYTKENASFPLVIDEITTLTNITAEADAIRYHYQVKGADMSNISVTSLKDNLLPQVCGKNDMVTLLNRGIKVQYLYTVYETGQDYLVTITQDDCA